MSAKKLPTLEELIAEIGWLPIQRYCQLTGQKASTLHMRRINGVWQEGVHISTPDGSCTYVNYKAVAAWCEATWRPAPPDVTKLLAEKILQEREEQVKLLDIPVPPPGS